MRSFGIGSSTEGWHGWQRDGEQELAAFDELGPLARQAISLLPRDVSVRKLRQKFVRARTNDYTGGDDEAPPSQTDFAGAHDAAFAAFVRNEYQRASGSDPLALILTPRQSLRSRWRR